MLRLNLTLGGNYIPSNPWVSKVRKDDNVASKVLIYVVEVSSLGW